jgi:hypothetical protein
MHIGTDFIGIIAGDGCVPAVIEVDKRFYCFHPASEG